MMKALKSYKQTKCSTSTVGWHTLIHIQNTRIERKIKYIESSNILIFSTVLQFEFKTNNKNYRIIFSRKNNQKNILMCSLLTDFCRLTILGRQSENILEIDPALSENWEKNDEKPKNILKSETKIDYSYNYQLKLNPLWKALTDWLSSSLRRSRLTVDLIGVKRISFQSCHGNVAKMFDCECFANGHNGNYSKNNRNTVEKRSMNRRECRKRDDLSRNNISIGDCCWLTKKKNIPYTVICQCHLYIMNQFHSKCNTITRKSPKTKIKILNKQSHILCNCGIVAMKSKTMTEMRDFIRFIDSLTLIQHQFDLVNSILTVFQ